MLLRCQPLAILGAHELQKSNARCQCLGRCGWSEHNLQDPWCPWCSSSNTGSRLAWGTITSLPYSMQPSWILSSSFRQVKGCSFSSMCYQPTSSPMTTDQSNAKSGWHVDTGKPCIVGCLWSLQGEGLMSNCVFESGSQLSVYVSLVAWFAPDL